MENRFLIAASPRLRPGWPLVLFALLVACAAPGRAEEVRVAVAANFSDALRQLASRFEAAHGHSVSVSVGSTGKLFAQVVHGAPFDVFFAADARRPSMLEDEGLGVPGRRGPYARGRLALWVPGVDALDDPAAWLRAGEFSHLSLANPRLAPYGRAARQALESLDLWAPLQAKLVRGENVGQAYHFVASGSADAGLVALSQLRKPEGPAEGATWVVPSSRHDPIEQHAILLRDAPAPRAFYDFVLGPAARPTLEAFGYEPPGEASSEVPALPPEDYGALTLTLKLALVTTSLLLLLGTPLAWWLARSRSRVRVVVEALVAMPLVLPPTVLGFYLLVLMGPEGPLGRLMLAAGGAPLVFRFEGLVLGSLVYSLPFVVQPLQASFEGLDERMLEAAATLGAGPLDRFYSVVLPLCRPGFVTAAVLGFAHTLGEFGVVLMVGGNIPGETKVLSIAIYDHVESVEYARAHALAGLMLALSFVLLLVVYTTNRHLRRGLR